MSETFPEPAEGYRPTGQHRAALKLIAGLVASGLILWGLSRLFGDVIGKDWIWIIAGLLWMANSIRTILSPERALDEYADQPEIDSMRRWHVAMLIFWTVTTTGYVLHLFGWLGIPA